MLVGHLFIIYLFIHYANHTKVHEKIMGKKHKKERKQTKNIMNSIRPLETTASTVSTYLFLDLCGTISYRGKSCRNAAIKMVTCGCCRGNIENVGLENAGSGKCRTWNTVF